jgi:hypothetical protein
VPNSPQCAAEHSRVGSSLPTHIWGLRKTERLSSQDCLPMTSGVCSLTRGPGQEPVFQEGTELLSVGHLGLPSYSRVKVVTAPRFLRKGLVPVFKSTKKSATMFQSHQEREGGWTLTMSACLLYSLSSASGFTPFLGGWPTFSMDYQLLTEPNSVPHPHSPYSARIIVVKCLLNTLSPERILTDDSNLCWINCPSQDCWQMLLNLFLYILNSAVQST